MITRRHLIKTLSAAPLGAFLPAIAGAAAFDVPALKTGYAQRLKKMLAAGELPYIDLESSCNSTKLDMDFVAQNMDRLNIGLMALSADIGSGQFKKGVRFDNLSERLIASYPDRFIPVGNGGQPPSLTEAPAEFLDAQEAAIRSGQMLCLGEYEFRHYPSPRQAKRGETEERDVQVPIDGPTGHRLFSLSEKTGMAFQLHYEIEDELLAPLEQMMAQYPKAKVIWCHLAQIRYIERASRYTPAYVDGLLKRFPNLYFDTAFGDPMSTYPLSHQRHARVWASDGNLDAGWRDLLVAHPTRFLSALDLGGDRMNQIPSYDQKHRYFLQRLPAEIRHQVAYRNAWALLFGEEFA
ncbi:amidohydrolase family protein [Polaromonas jejuensis]|uniref:Amidohydrolase family protein n=1 Tax=Polaromonas jejuensis TaxID=457502 RepID=A0ABW0QHP5_9BURK|nr:amidohydrolase family protein [Polaromonas jejuensis]